MNSFLQNSDSILKWTRNGLYCPGGDFYIDPKGVVPRAIISHAHSDHARQGSNYYLCSDSGIALLKARLGKTATIESIPFGERIKIGDVMISLHPAGHILGSAQIRIEHRGKIWVVSGDYKTLPDLSCESWEPVRCDTFITESTFALPVYHWPDEKWEYGEIIEWWTKNQEMGKTSFLFAYALGKAQRLLRQLADYTDSTIGVTSEVARYLPFYAKQGCAFGKILTLNASNLSEFSNGGLIISPASVRKSGWFEKWGSYSCAFASGWMLIKPIKMEENLDRGFVISDHADWPGILFAIGESGAENVGVVHGFTDTLVRYLNEELALNAFKVEDLPSP